MQTNGNRSKAALIFLVFSLASAVFAQNAAAPGPRLSPDPRLAAAGVSGATSEVPPLLDPAVFARLSLVASGAEDGRIDSLMTRLDAVARDLANSLPSGADERTKGEAVLEILYGRILSRYSEFQTRVDAALLTGEYNCVSSAVLYYYLARTVGLEVEGVETPLHAFCTVAAAGRKIDVETTNPYGFDPGAKKELADSTPDRQKFVLVPQTKYRDRKPVDERRMLALIYNNRISLLERRGVFIEAVGLAVDAHYLQGRGSADKDLGERFLNYSISLSKGGRDTEGLEFIRRAATLWGERAEYAEYVSSAAGNRLNTLMKKKDFGTAFAFLSEYASMIGTARHAEYSLLLHVNNLSSIIETASFQDALAAIKTARGSIDKAGYEQMIVYAYSREADSLGRSGKWLDASAVLDRGLVEVPRQPDLLRQRTVYRQNHAIEVHNRVVQAYNSGNRDGVRKLLEEGLALVPESTLLQNDLKRLE